LCSGRLPRGFWSRCAWRGWLVATWATVGLGVTGSAQWVITAIHPDPTPPVGAPEAEYVAILASGTTDSCISLAGHELRWNGHVRSLPEGCWPPETVLVVHRSSDSADFDFGSAVALGLNSWPALLNGGGTVSIWDPAGRLLDAMPYDADALGDGGRPLMRSSVLACGGRENQHLWTPGMNPFHSERPDAVEVMEDWPDTERLMKLAGEAGRLVPRGPGQLDWYLGSGLDPVRNLTARGWVDGLPASLEWRSDSVVRMVWSERPLGAPGLNEENRLVQLGPLKACAPASRNHMLFRSWPKRRNSGAVEIVGVLSDPDPGDPHYSEESLTIANVGSDSLDMGSWNFGGAQLSRSVVLPAEQSVTLVASQFEHWPGMPNAGGGFDIESSSGKRLAEAIWNPCDYSLPDHVGSGLGLHRPHQAGAGWVTAGLDFPERPEEWTIKGYGCPVDFWGYTGLDLYFSRYLAHLPEMEWQMEHGSRVSADRIEMRGDVLHLTWEDMEDALSGSEGVVVNAQVEGSGNRELMAQCPSLGEFTEPCLRVNEMMWDAPSTGAEFVELVNCGSKPLDLAGLQATTVRDPWPSDWRTWLSTGTSLVLPPGSVAAFGPCASWMANGLSSSGPSRWSAEDWSPLNDHAGSLAIRLPGQSAQILDEVAWDDGLRKPWWYSGDGWAWVRSGGGVADWSPAHDRGSPGVLLGPPTPDDCTDAVTWETAMERALGGLHWAFPDAGGKLTVRVVHFPTGTLLDEAVIERPQAQGVWSWRGDVPMALAHHGGQLMLDVRWWSASCKGRKLFRVDMPLGE